MFMLDTNTVSDLIRQDPNVMTRLSYIRPATVCLSSITAAELLYGITKRQSRKLDTAVRGILGVMSVCNWDTEAAVWYGGLRVTMEKRQWHGCVGSTDCCPCHESSFNPGDQ